MILDFLLDPLAYAFMQRALIASVLVGLVCGTLGCYIVLRRMALIGDALSHAVLPGAAIAFILGANDFFLGAAIAGIVTALLIGWVTANSRVKEDAAIGVVFTGAFALGIVLITMIQSRSVDLFHMLFGNVLGVDSRDLWITAAITGIVLLTIFLLFKELLLHAFDPIMAAAIGLPTKGLHYLLMVLLSLTVVASLQTVGLVLVVAMLITPASTAYLLTDRFSRMLAISAAIGVASSVLGLYGSYYGNVSSGASIVLVATFFFFMAFLFSPQRGLVVRRVRARRAGRRTDLEDALKYVYALQSEGGDASPPALAERMGTATREAEKRMGGLRKRGWMRNGTLTREGSEHAETLVRAHRLWERYLVDEGVATQADVHGEAERLEHIAPVAMADRLDRELGSPTADPHGRPIPRRPRGLTPDVLALDEWPVGQDGVIVAIREKTPEGLHRLADLELTAGTRLRVLDRDDGGVELRVDGRPIQVEHDLAGTILVSPP